MTGCETTIAKGSHGQLLVTVPKQMAESLGIGKGHKVCWHCDMKSRRVFGEVILR
jgi:hypothetical protein